MEWLYAIIALIGLYAIYAVIGWVYNTVIYPIVERFSPEVVTVPRYKCLNELPTGKELAAEYSGPKDALFHLKKFPDFFQLLFWRKDFTIVSAVFCVSDGALHSYLRHFQQWNHILPELRKPFNDIPKELKDLMKSYTNSKDGTPENLTIRDKIQTYLKSLSKDSKVLETIANIERKCLSYLADVVKDESKVSQRLSKDDGKVEWTYALDDDTDMKLVFASDFRGRTHCSSKGRQISKLITAYMYFY